MDAERLKQAVRKTYASRAANDVEGTAAIFAPGGVYRVAGASGASLAQDAMAAGLKEQFTIFPATAFAVSSIIADGNKVVAIVDASFAFGPTGEAIHSQLAHFWTFENDKAIELIEFRDTALVDSLLAQVSPSVPAS